MKPIVSDPKLVANCGLYCGACPSYLNDRCPGCQKNDGATWCQVRKCCRQESYASCADCKTHADPQDCGKFHNWMSRIIGFFLNSNRKACIVQIREKGLQGHADAMATQKRQTLPR